MFSGTYCALARGPGGSTSRRVCVAVERETRSKGTRVPRSANRGGMPAMTRTRTGEFRRSVLGRLTAEGARTGRRGGAKQ